MISIALAATAFYLNPFADTMPPWETWFDFLGLFWSMTLSSSLTLLVLFAPSAFLAGIFQQFDCKSGMIFMFHLTFLLLFVYLFPRSPALDFSFQLILAFLVAILTLAPFSVGHLIKATFLLQQKNLPN
ncbi:MAG: hypothetical protein HC904_14700 [Blastochloris sp.]|nr:hypothetical protein [Blastochloris sp.]